MNRVQTVNLKTPVASSVNPNSVADTVEASSPTTDTIGGERATPFQNPSLKNWTGEVLGEYEIGELIGVGGNGQVFRARHRCLDMSVALKILHGVEADDEASVDRFRREAMASARLIHPNLVRATDAGILDRHLFLVTDFVDGMDLNELVNRKGALSVANVCEIGRSACAGLHYLAANNTVHRDIKPSNIMVDRSGHVRVLDLGLARTNGLSHSLTVEGQLMGTLDYMSPEQAISPRDVGFHADMYSLGCTLYFLLAGKAPYQDEMFETMTAKLLAHMEVPAVPVEQIRSDLPQSITRVVMAMLEKDVANRPASFEQVMDVLSEHAVNQNLSGLVCGDEANAVVPTLVPPKMVSPRPTKSAHPATSVETMVQTTATNLIKPLAMFGIVLAVGWWLSPFGMSGRLPQQIATVETIPGCSPLTTQGATSTACETPSTPVMPRDVTRDPAVIHQTEADRAPPPGLSREHQKEWEIYLKRPMHKAWFHNPQTGSYGYSTSNRSQEDAIRNARAYAAGKSCKLYSVDGFLVVPKKTAKKLTPKASGPTRLNAFAAPSH